MTPEEMKAVCISLALDDTVHVGNAYDKRDRLHSYLGVLGTLNEQGASLFFKPTSTYNEDALVVLAWLNERYPEG